MGTRICQATTSGTFTKFFATMDVPSNPGTDSGSFALWIGLSDGNHVIQTGLWWGGTQWTPFCEAVDDNTGQQPTGSPAWGSTVTTGSTVDFLIEWTGSNWFIECYSNGSQLSVTSIGSYTLGSSMSIAIAADEVFTESSCSDIQFLSGAFKSMTLNDGSGSVSWSKGDTDTCGMTSSLSNATSNGSTQYTFTHTG